MTHNCIKCDTHLVIDENWHESRKVAKHYICKYCHATACNDKRMYVNGKYVPTSHPLYKAGVYKTFDDAAFSSLTNYNTTTSGHVYAMGNAAWPEWVKIGKAVDAEDRLSSYQTSSPLRDYTMVHYAYTDDRNIAERQAHVLAGKLGDKRNEWFKISNEDAVVVIEQAVSEEMEIFYNE
jgi:hypothetical protein